MPQRGISLMAARPDPAQSQVRPARATGLGREATPTTALVRPQRRFEGLDATQWATGCPPARKWLSGRFWARQGVLGGAGGPAPRQRRRTPACGGADSNLGAQLNAAGPMPPASPYGGPALGCAPSAQPRAAPACSSAAGQGGWTGPHHHLAAGRALAGQRGRGAARRVGRWQR